MDIIKKSRVYAGRRSTATFSKDFMYRYLLTRSWKGGSGKILTYCMVNPSDADEFNEDPTSATCIGIARHQDYSSIEIVNLFAYISSDVKYLQTPKDPVGLYNDLFIEDAVKRTDQLVVAWGRNGSYLNRDSKMKIMLNMWVKQYKKPDMVCLALNDDGTPRHPLYCKRKTPFIPFP